MKNTGRRVYFGRLAHISYGTLNKNNSYLLAKREQIVHE